MILDRSKFPDLARRIVALPELDLARADRRPVIDLSIECQRANYIYGEWYLQLLAIRARHADDPQVRYRTKEFVENLRAQVWMDAGVPLGRTIAFPCPPFSRRSDAPDDIEDKLRLARAT